jgi:hypothetical protein
MTTKVQNGHKIYHFAVKNVDKMSIKKYKHLPLQDLIRFARIGIFGLKIYHLATLVRALAPKFLKEKYVGC